MAKTQKCFFVWLADTHVHLLNIYIKYMLIGTRVRKYVGETAIA